ncbi:MAG: sulfatase-like hydrolase/transferase, partial [Armatimonadota bacterium]
CGFDYSFITAACSKIDAPHVFIENGKCTVEPTLWYEKRSEKRDDSARTGFADPDFPFRDVDTVFVQQAAKFIAENRDRPFFLYLPLSAPHAPFWPPAYAKGKTHSLRGDLVHVVDHCVGQIDAALREHGLAENTIVIFASDNGPREDGGGHDPSGPYRGLKSHIWEGGHRIPLVVRWPGTTRPNSKTAQPVELNDLYATFAHMLGASLEDNAAPDSFDMLPILRGEPQAGNIRPFMIHHSVYGVFSIRRENWKLILGTKGSGGWVTPGDATVRRSVDHPDTIGQLYDMDEDPYETTDLYEAKPEIVRALTDMLEGFKRSGRSVER